MSSLPTSSSNDPALSNPTQSWGERWRSARFPTIVSSILVFVIGILVYLQFTLVVGTELNTQTWELRDFTFRRDPFTNTQLTGLYHSSGSHVGTWVSATPGAPSLPDTAIRSYLTAKNLTSSRWDLVRLSDRTESTGRAAILVRLIESDQFAEREYWIGWSNSEPKKAAVLWPAAQQLVDRGHYNQLPDLFELTLYEKDDTAFINAVSSFLKSIATTSPAK